MRIDPRLFGLANSLIFVPAIAAAESGSPHAATVAARTTRPGCAKLVCQRQGVAGDRFDGHRSEGSGGETSETHVSLVMGLGAAAFRGPALDLGLITVTQEGTGDPLGVPIDSEMVAGDTYESLGSRRAELDGPALSLGVSLDQPLFGIGALGVGFEERFTLSGLLPVSGGSFIAGVTDILLVASGFDWPIDVAIGPSLAVARLDVEGDDADGGYDEPAFITSVAALLRLGLPYTLPGTLAVVGHYGSSLNYDDWSYRDLQLAFALEL